MLRIPIPREDCSATTLDKESPSHTRSLDGAREDRPPTKAVGRKKTGCRRMSTRVPLSLVGGPYSRVRLSLPAHCQNASQGSRIH